jgi:hypothetical protein
VSARRFTAAVLLTVAIVGVTATRAGATSLSTMAALSGAVSADMTAASEAANRGDFAGLEEACISLQDDTATFLDSTRPSAMNRSAWKLSVRGMRYLNLSAEQCIIGATEYDADAIRLSTSYLNRGSDLIRQATARMGGGS